LPDTELVEDDDVSQSELAEHVLAEVAGLCDDGVVSPSAPTCRSAGSISFVCMR
jgi:hypothetical protein